MRPWITIAVIAGFAVLGWALMLRSQEAGRPASREKDEKRTITTAGSATVRTKPDSARVFFGVQTTAKTVKTARDENSRLCKKVVDALGALKIPGLKMKTSDINVELIHAPQSDQTRGLEVLGYRVTTSYTVLVHEEDTTKLGGMASAVLDAALENGANFVQQIVMFRQDDTEIRRRALTLAVEAALANARALGQGANLQPREPLRIVGEPEYSLGRAQVLTNSAYTGGGSEGSVILGDLEITVRVQVTCAMEQAG